MDAETADSDRPSFTSFWKRVKQKEKQEGDGHKKKGKKTSSPSSAGELQEEAYAEDQEADRDAGECS